MLDEHISPAVTLGLGDGHSFKNSIEVVADAQALEDTRLLREITDAEAGAFIHRQLRNVHTFEDHRAAVLEQSYP